MGSVAMDSTRESAMDSDIGGAQSSGRSSSTITNPFSSSLGSAVSASASTSPFSRRSGASCASVVEMAPRRVLLAEAASGVAVTSSAFSSEMGTRVPRRDEDGVDILCEEEVDDEDSDDDDD